MWWLLLGVPGFAVGNYTLYWVIRLALRHGIGDAELNREQRAREEAAWDPARTR
jgi:hypothetical protein